MESPFKPLAELKQADSRNQLWVVLDRSAPGGTRPLTLEDEHAEMACLELPPSVPENVRHDFAAVRMLWTYGWFYYPFYTWAGFHAAICAEGALLQRLGYSERRDEHSPGLRSLLKEAVSLGLIRDEGFEHAQRLRKARDEDRESYRQIADVTGHAEILEDKVRDYVDTLVDTFPHLRNMHAHPRSYFYTLPGGGRLMVELTRDLIAQLYPEQSSYALLGA